MRALHIRSRANRRRTGEHEHNVWIFGRRHHYRALKLYSWWWNLNFSLILKRLLSCELLPSKMIQERVRERHHSVLIILLQPWNPSHVYFDTIPI